MATQEIDRREHGRIREEQAKNKKSREVLGKMERKNGEESTQEQGRIGQGTGKKGTNENQGRSFKEHGKSKEEPARTGKDKERTRKECGSTTDK